jgi:hypothetical protein
MQSKIIFVAPYLRQFGLSLITFLIFVPPAWPAASISQRTEGSCSPTVADVKGNVSIVCTGVDPALSKEIVKLLNEILQDTKKMEQMRQELDRASKRTDRLEARQTPRRLTENQQAELVSLLSSKPGQPIQVGGIANNAESMTYAEELQITLAMAGWPVKKLSARQIIGRIPVGLHIRYKDEEGASPAAQFLAQSFRKVGVEVNVDERPRMESGIIDIMVGVKPD